MEDFFICFGYSLGFGFIFAKIFYILINAKRIDFSRFFLDYDYMLSYMRGGFVFYGGLIGVLIAFLFVYHIHKINSLYIANFIAPIFPLAHAFGRIGCYYAGCCFGMPVTPDCWHVIYQSPLHPAKNIPLLPIQLIEAFLNTLLFIALSLYLIYMLKHKRINILSANEALQKLSLHSVVEYRLLFLYILGYSILRFFIEFFRYDMERGFILYLSTSQIISLIFIIILLFAFILNIKSKQ